MKKVSVLICLLISIALLLIGCSSNSQAKNEKKTINATKTEVQKTDIRESVWNQLSDAQKEKVIGSWNDAKMEKSLAQSKSAYLYDNKYDGKEVYLLTFKSTKEMMLGDLMVYADIETGKLVGVILRD